MLDTAGKTPPLPEELDEELELEEEEEDELLIHHHEPEDELELEDDELDELLEIHHHCALTVDANMPVINRHARAIMINCRFDFFSIKNLPLSTISVVF